MSIIKNLAYNHLELYLFNILYLFILIQIICLFFERKKFLIFIIMHYIKLYITIIKYEMPL